MLSLLTIQQDCKRDYRKYADTVAVLSAIYHILKKEPSIADYVGIERKLRNNGQEVEPDLVALYDNRKKGLLFEFKYSLPFEEDLLEKKLRNFENMLGNFQIGEAPLVK